ncbi:hypothetical protein AAHE18_08G026800 [Arachis hypogaea]
MGLSFFISLSLSVGGSSRCRRWCSPSPPSLVFPIAAVAGFSRSVTVRPILYCSPHLLYASADFLFAVAGPGLRFLSCHTMFCCAAIARVSTVLSSLGKGFIAPPSLLYICSVSTIVGEC